MKFMNCFKKLRKATFIGCFQTSSDLKMKDSHKNVDRMKLKRNETIVKYAELPIFNNGIPCI